MRRLLRWGFRLVLGLVVLIVVAAAVMILLLDTLAKEVIVNRLRSRTGMEVKVGSVHVGLLSPTLSIENVKIYNTADFGGSVCLDMPELHLEYDPSALRAGHLHLTLLRLDIAELSLVVNKSNRMNFDTLKRKSNESNDHKTRLERMKFTGIDVLNVTLGKFHKTNLASGRSEEMDFGIKNQVLRNVKTGGDLSPLGVAALSHPKPNSPGNTDMDLGQVIEELLKTP
jgi:uncharacterized protein involved in outer membrane biogenesis